MPKDTKRWYESRTIWFNVVTFILGGLGALSPEMMPSWFGEAMVTTNLVGNIILRKITDTRIQ